jgi:predicted nicotinamide N-methyase
MSDLRFRFHTHDFGSHDIHLRTLRDNQQYLDLDGEAEKLHINSASWSHFGIVWASGQVLAHLMQDYAIAGKRILEMGCGIGLPSMVLNHRHADITATDYHPQAEAFLIFNTALNSEKPIPFYRADWLQDDCDMGTFDVLVGSDILYEQDHVELLAGFIGRHANAACEVILVDPDRHQHARFSKKMISLGFVHSQSRPVQAAYLDIPFKGQILRYVRE